MPESPYTPQAADLTVAARARTNFALFNRLFWEISNPGRPLQWEEYHDVLCAHAQAVIDGRIKKLLVTLPSGTTKSTIFSVNLVAYVWATDPTRRFLNGSNAQENTDRDSMACRRVIESELYRLAYRSRIETDPDTGERTYLPTWALATDQNQKNWYENTRTGHRQGVTVNGTITGKKGDILILDDVHDARKVNSKAERNKVKLWFTEGFYSRTNDDTDARYIVVGHRTHVNDLQSELIKAGDWVELRMPEQCEVSHRTVTPLWTDKRAEGELLRPKRFGLAQVEDKKRTMGPTAYAAQHQQRPQSREGRMFPREKIRIVPEMPIGTRLVRYWDTAASEGETACFSSGVLMGRTPDGRTVIVDERRGRWVPGDRNNVMRTTGFLDMRRTGKVSYHLYFEKGASDSGVERDSNLITFLAGLPVKADPAKGDKVTRAEPFHSQWIAGNVLIVAGDWNAAYLDAMESFPESGRDTADASSGAFNRLATGGDGEFTTAPDDETEMGRLPAGTFRKGTVI